MPESLAFAFPDPHNLSPNPRPEIDVSAVLLPRPVAPLDWRDVFQNDHPVELEVGSGKGLFLASEALANPARNYLGIEIARKYARKCAERLVKHAVPNARVISDDAKRLIRECIADSSLDAIHVYFPDPWWKKRHKKRRVFSHEFVAAAARVLKPGGRLAIATDVEEYFLVMTALVGENPAWQRLDDALDAQPGAGPRTNFERKYQIEGRPIYSAAFRFLGLIQPAPASRH